MAIYCKKYNLLFIMAPRTACTAVGNVLISELDGEYLPHTDVADINGKFVLQKKHGTLQQLLYHKILSKELLDNLYVFTTVRNHFDNLYSLYVKQKLKYKPLIDDHDSWVHKVPGYVDAINSIQQLEFDEWILKSFNVPWYKRIVDKGHRTLYLEFTQHADYILHFENLQDDFNHVLKQVGVEKEIIIPRQNETGEKIYKSYREAYSTKSKELIEYVFKKEMKAHGYEF